MYKPNPQTENSAAKQLLHFGGRKFRAEFLSMKYKAFKLTLRRNWSQEQQQTSANAWKTQKISRAQTFPSTICRQRVKTQEICWTSWENNSRKWRGSKWPEKMECLAILCNISCLQFNIRGNTVFCERIYPTSKPTWNSLGNIGLNCFLTSLCIQCLEACLATKTLRKLWQKHSMTWNLE